LVITPLLAHCSGSVRAVPLAVPGGGAPGPRIRAAALAGSEDTLSVLAEGTPLALWYLARAPAKLGLPAPIRLLLERLASPAGAQTQMFD
ncbi:MAG TPA: hypothetical protein VN735_10965, partial [Steroidobacteraceae bacterium]|nr:hypothetical protein [Steroidobacteraceae bacterium]